MKNTLIALTTLLSLSTLASNQGVLHLKGVVGQVLSIDVQATSDATALDLHTTAKDLHVADVTEVSNSNSGYKVSVSSQNKGKLVHADGDAVGQVTYEMKYDGKNINLTSGDEFVDSSSEAVSEVKEVSISYTGIPQTQLVAGEYTDNVTFTISAN